MDRATYSYFQVNRPRCRGTALVKLLYVPTDCRCRAPTIDVVQIGENCCKSRIYLDILIHSRNGTFYLRKLAFTQGRLIYIYRLKNSAKKRWSFWRKIFLFIWIYLLAASKLVRKKSQDM